MVCTCMSFREWTRRSLALSVIRLMYTQQRSVAFLTVSRKTGLW